MAGGGRGVVHTRMRDFLAQRTDPQVVMSSLTATPAGPLSGVTGVPGDKSISHRALILGALAVGETTIEGLLEADDVYRTAAALEALGAEIVREGPAGWRVYGRGVGGLREPRTVLDLGNAGTGARLLMGAAASHDLTAHFTGDPSLSARPMDRVAEPLRELGARLVMRAGRYMPLAVTGTAAPLPITYRLPVPSAQVKSALLLAGLNAPGTTTVIEPAPTRDHTERLMQRFGAEIAVEDGAEGERTIALQGQPELEGAAVAIAGDASSAAFVAVAALVVPGSAVTIQNVGVNPLRTGLFECLAEMGAEVRLDNRRTLSGEEVADVVVRAGPLRGISVPAERAVSMIDEYPVLAVAAACAEGETEMHGLAELRVKESDRLAAIVGGLRACGIEAEESAAALIVRGSGGRPPGGGTIAVARDHRIAMAFLVLGLAARSPVRIDDGAAIATSFPGFAALLGALGAAIEPGRSA